MTNRRTAMSINSNTNAATTHHCQMSVSVAACGAVFGITKTVSGDGLKRPSVNSLRRRSKGKFVRVKRYSGG